MRASRAITLLGTAFSSRIYMMTFKYHPRQQNSRRIYTSMRIENQNSISSIHRKSKFDQLYASKIKIQSALSPGVLLARVIFIKMPSSVMIRCASIFYAHVLRFQKLVRAHKAGRQ